MLAMLPPLLLALLLAVPAMSDERETLRVATFNVSMESSNYLPRGQTPSGDELRRALRDDHPQIRNIAEIIQRLRPDILLLNEFDYRADPADHVEPFLREFLAVGQNGQAPIDYPYYYQAPVNTGVDSGLDLDGDGVASGTGQDAFGYGLYPGQYGMLLLSRHPIDRGALRSFQRFLWRDMPGNLLEDMPGDDGQPFYPPPAQAQLRLSSKSHWDIPVEVDGRRVHVLASHPTPPVFDGPEDRNGRRNHDEIRFWVDYLSGEGADYVYDDAGHRGGLSGERFVILGDLNASPDEGDARRGAIAALVGHARVASPLAPSSEGGQRARRDNPLAATHTALWGLRADYVLPSRDGWRVEDSGVFWPAPGDPLHRLVADRRASSDHRLVWVDLSLSE